jgi:hypothetical protein
LGKIFFSYLHGDPKDTNDSKPSDTIEIKEDLQPKEEMQTLPITSPHGIPISSNLPSDTIRIEKVVEERVKKTLEKEQKQWEAMKRRVKELEELTRRLKQENQSIVEEKIKTVEELQQNVIFYKELVEKTTQEQQEMQRKFEEREALFQRERQKSLSLFNVMEQSAKELRDVEDQRLKAELELEKKTKELEFFQEKLEKEKEKVSNKEEIQTMRLEKKQIIDQYEKEKSRMEETLSKVRISLEADVKQYKEKTEQLASQLEKYEKSFQEWDELEKQRKEMESRLEQERKLKEKAEKQQLIYKDELEKLQKDINNIVQLSKVGELDTGHKLLGSGGEAYVIQKKLGRGGMGIAYLANRKSDSLPVVIKTLFPEVMEDLKQVLRFIQEAHTILNFNHPNLVKGYDMYQSQNFSYFVMEYIDGKSAETLLEELTMLDQIEATDIVLGIAKGLCCLEKNHLVHRDIKPANIIISTQGVPKLVDFGIVKMIDKTCALTTQGIILGTPYYLSPEQTRGINVDIRSDIYSLGATYYHFVVGDVPFTGDDPVEVIHKRLKVAPKPGKENPKLNKELCRIIEKMMSENLKKRYISAVDLVQDLEKLSKQLRG